MIQEENSDQAEKSRECQPDHKLNWTFAVDTGHTWMRERDDVRFISDVKNFVLEINVIEIEHTP